MIRINLLPQAVRATSAGASGQAWAVVYGAVAAVWCIVLLVVYLIGNNELEELETRNNDLSQKIDTLKQQSADLETLKEKLAKSQELEEVVDGLQRARLGPTNIMLELSRILSHGGGPTVDKEVLEKMREENPLAGYSPKWDGRRLWLTGFSEEDRECTLRGLGKTNEDIAEFLRRLAISEFFEEVTLQKSQMDRSSNSKNDVDMIGFTVTCRVKY
ncbi:MAG: PilN domain-containing protein [Myxococcales bacterium]|nr:MAG: PilN domain-containing protein [Myxococcales bacterium]